MSLSTLTAVGSSTKLILRAAVLIYEAKNGNSPLATIHQIQHAEKGPPMLLPGEAITSSDVESLARTLSTAADTMTWLPPHVLTLSSNRLVWYLPSQRRRIWFNAEAKPYRHLNGKEVTWPALIFDATINAGLRILALGSDARPTPETPLFRAPCMNLYSLGEMCRGNAPMPKVFSTEAMKMYEDSFFKSAFSHTNLSGKALCNHPQGPVRMWNELRTLRKFPAKWLVSLSKAKGERSHHDDSKVHTVGDLLKPQKWTGYHPL